jgi:hypothetical protein
MMPFATAERRPEKIVARVRASAASPSPMAAKLFEHEYTRRSAYRIDQLCVLKQTGAIDPDAGIAGKQQAEAVAHIRDDRQSGRWRMAGIDALRLLFQDIADILKKRGRSERFQPAVKAHLSHGIGGGKGRDAAGTQPTVICSGRVGRAVENGQNPSGNEKRHIVPRLCGVLVFRLRKARDIHLSGVLAEGGWRRHMGRRCCSFE